MATLASEIITLTRNIAKEESGTDLPVAGDDFLLTAISDGNLKWAEQFQVDGAAPLIFQRETGFDLVAETAINDTNGTTTASTSITVDSQTFLDSAGVAVVWDDAMPDFFSYTSQTATLFSGVSGLSFAHEDDDPIAPLYKLPSNFGEFRQAPDYGDGVQLNGYGLKYTGGPPLSGFFSMYDDGTNKYLWLPRQSSGSASVWYDKVSSTISSPSDTVDVPDHYKFFLVWHALAFLYMGKADLVPLYQFAQGEEEKVLQRALSRRNVGKKIRPRPFGKYFRNSVIINGRLVSI